MGSPLTLEAWMERLGPGWDAQAVDDLMALDPQAEAGLVLTLMSRFAQSLQQWDTALEQAWQGRDAEVLRRGAHTLKSSAATVGAARLAAAARAFEQALVARGFGPELQAPWRHLQGELQAAAQVLHPALSGGPT